MVSFQSESSSWGCLQGPPLSSTRDRSLPILQYLGCVLLSYRVLDLHRLQGFGFPDRQVCHGVGSAFGAGGRATGTSFSIQQDTFKLSGTRFISTRAEGVYNKEVAYWSSCPVDIELDGQQVLPPVPASTHVPVLPPHLFMCRLSWH